MCFSGPDYPDPPDPVATAQAQGDVSLAGAIAGNEMKMVDKIGPDGSVRYKQKGTMTIDDGFGGTVDVPKYMEITRLSPEQRKIFNQSNDAKLSMAKTAANSADFMKSYLNKQIDPSSLPARGKLPGNSTGNIDTRLSTRPDYQESLDRRTTQNLDTRIGYDPKYQRSYGQDGNWNDIRDQYTDALMRRAQPGMDQQRKALEADLVNRGVNIGSEAYSDAHFNRQQGENDMRMAAILAGGDEAQRMEGLARDRATFKNDVQGKILDDEIRKASFQNTALGQKFGQQQDMANFYNNIQSQQLQDELTKSTFQNSALGQKFGESLSKANFDEAKRAAALSEKFAFRNQPINEISALLSGSQVSMPQFDSPQISGPATTDYAGLVTNIYGQQSQNAADEYAARTNLYGNILGAGGDVAGAWINR